MRLPKSKKGFIIPLEVGFLFIASAFLVLSLDFARTTGVFYSEKTMPVTMMSKELEAITSTLYSMPEDATVIYNGPNACRWNTRINKLECQGGLELEEIGFITSFTKDQTRVYIPSAHCVYINIMTTLQKYYKSLSEAVAKGKRAGESAMDVLGKGKKLKFYNFGNRLSKLKSSAFGFIGRLIPGRLKAIASSVSESVSRNVERLKGRFTFLDDLYEKIGITRTTLREGLDKIDDEFGEEILEATGRRVTDDDFVDFLSERAKRGDPQAESTIIAINEVTGNNLVWELTDESGDLVWELVDEEAAEAAEDFFALLYSEMLLYDDVAYLGKDAVMQFAKTGTLPRTTKLGYLTSRGRLKDLARVAGAYASCVSNEPLVNVLAFFLSGQLYVKVDRNRDYNFHDFYAGKFGAISINFTDGVDYISHNTMFGLNGEDMCFQREYITTMHDNYAITPMNMENGKILFTKTKASFDTLCDPSSEYFPTGIYEIAKKVHEISKPEIPPAATSVKVLLGPGKMIAVKFNVCGESSCTDDNDNDADGKTDELVDKLCEVKVERSTDGAMESWDGDGDPWFDIFCYDFDDMGVDVEFNFVSAGIDYGRAEDVDIDGTFWEAKFGEDTFTELGNEYWFMHFYGIEMDSSIGITIPIPVISDILQGIFDFFPPWYFPETPDSTEINQKLGFFQSQYFECDITISREDDTVTIGSPVTCKPLLFENQDNIYTDEQVTEMPTIKSSRCGSYFAVVLDYVECSYCDQFCASGTGTCYGGTTPEEYVCSNIVTSREWTSTGAYCSYLINGVTSSGECICYEDTICSVACLDGVCT